MTGTQRVSLLLALFALLSGLATVGSAQASSGVESHPMIGTAAPRFTLVGVDGESLGLADLRGEFVVIHFGTSW
jgi:cytochrome oxidase Cu insertion factor (SCO1/SenC/PrrC family)